MIGIKNMLVSIDKASQEKKPEFRDSEVVTIMLAMDFIRLGVTLTNSGLLDTKPVPVVGYRCSKKRSDFQGSAAYGYCVVYFMLTRQEPYQENYLSGR